MVDSQKYNVRRKKEVKEEYTGYELIHKSFKDRQHRTVLRNAHIGDKNVNKSKGLITSVSEFSVYL